MMEIINKFKNNKMSKIFSYSMLTTITNQIRWFFLIWVAAKMLSVDNYGVFTLIILLMMTAIELSDLGVNAATTRFVAQFYQIKELDKMYGIISLALRTKVRNSIIIIAMIVIFSNYVSTYLLGTESYSHLIILSTTGIFFGLIVGMNNAILQGKLAFYINLKISIITTLMALLFIAYAWYTDIFNVENFIIIYICTLCVNFASSLWYLREDVKLCLKSKVDLEHVKLEFNSFSGWMFLWAIIVIFQSKIDMIMLASLSNMEEVAYYDIAMKFTKPFLMIFAAYGQVLNPLMSGFKNKIDLLCQVKNTYKFLFIMTVGIVLVIICSSYMIRLIIGEEYDMAILPLQIIMVGVMFFLWTMPYNTAIYALKKPYIFTVEAVAGMIVTVCGNYVLLGEYGSNGAAITFMLAQIIGFVISYVAYKKTIRQYGD